MSSQRTIMIGVALAVVSATVALVSVLFMALRVSDYYRENPPPEFLPRTMIGREFTLFDRPVTIRDARDEDGHAALRITYGDESMLLRVHAPKVRDLPELGGYDEWVALASFVRLEAGQRVTEQPGAQPTDLRVAVVSRNAAPGQEDDMAGLVGRKQWTFDLVEFMHDGQLRRRRVQFPAIEYGTGKRYLPAKRENPEAQVEAIAERSWEFQAALLVIPRLQISNYRFRDTAVKIMGWTLPGAGLGILGVVGGVALLQAGRLGRRREGAVHSPPASAQGT